MKENEWLTGRNPVFEALHSSASVQKIWVAEGVKKGAIQGLVSKAKERNIAINYVPRKKIDQLTGIQNHQGIAASVSAYAFADMDVLFARAAEKGQAPFFILLDGIEDPQNLGSILRSADAAGADGVIIPKHGASGLTGAVAKASAGAIEHVPVVKVTNLARTMERLKKEGLWMVGTDASAEADYRTLDGEMPVVLVIGSEGKGMSRLVREACDFLYQIPMAGDVSSLNAAVSCSLLLYEVQRKRHPLGGAT
ncbi:23S rRNA (guanosine(2251)-2'-O)-methyltransferase RlmB [Salicibibacter kimchii]|uniref:23S rRNA (Guanosine(2251)-2'-O)-methyltransferase RlmB n=1 Tax=Salicibibacter kimchii TaxID=2099786 RepID=A0A345C0A4_9BACI|nr:23S rRNA (guanosine(2251)-2'-O)-methyltransferase RlmB [Salicibibacter kimchii]AXF56635.1 23S rRNA (guanosine(2251)-2'-O)-methyltransferase RlmB [Salicibibacter kimchii]